jgi:hypothetical protein
MLVISKDLVQIQNGAKYKMNNHQNNPCSQVQQLSVFLIYRNSTFQITLPNVRT